MSLTKEDYNKAWKQATSTTTRIPIESEDRCLKCGKDIRSERRLFYCIGCGGQGDEEVTLTEGKPIEEIPESQIENPLKHPTPSPLPPLPPIVRPPTTELFERIANGEGWEVY